MSTINSLGIGSGVLTADILDKLRVADDAAIIKPLEDKLALSTQKEEAYTLLSSFMNTFKTSVSTLGGDSLYLARTVSGNTDAVTVRAEGGSDVQSFNITNVSKAEKDVWNALAQTNKTVAMPGLGEGTLTINIGAVNGVGGTDYEIAYTATSTLDDIKTSLNDIAGEKMTASVLQVGEGQYQLMVTGDSTNQAITFSDSNDDSDPDALSLSTTLGFNDSANNIQKAKAATFNYNGVSITRSSNDISDLINGVTITLNQNQTAEQSANIKIAQNDISVTSEMEMFVTNFNTLSSNLKDMTTTDQTKGVAGIFSGESFIKSISRDITKILTDVDSNGNSLMNYGIDIDRYGVMTLDSAVFSEKFIADPNALELLFSGDSETDGTFTKLNTKMADYTGFGKLMSNFSDQIGTTKESLISQYDKQKASLDTRYETMTKKFTAYDAMISRMNSQFSSLQMMIDAQANTSSN